MRFIGKSKHTHLTKDNFVPAPGISLFSSRDDLTVN